MHEVPNHVYEIPRPNTPTDQTQNPVLYPADFYPGREFDDAASFVAFGEGFTDIGDWRRNNINLLISDLSESLPQQ